MEVSFDYGDPALLEFSEDQFFLGGHRVAGDQNSGVFTIVIGDEFRLVDKTLVPEVTIVDLSSDMDRIRLVAQAVVDEY